MSNVTDLLSGFYPGTTIRLIRGGEDVSDAGTSDATSTEGAAADTGPLPTYEIDEQAGPAEGPSDTSQSASAPPPPASSAAAPSGAASGTPPDSRAIEERALRAERLVNELRTQFAPLIDERTRRLSEAASKPPVDPERIRRGEADAGELLQYLEWQREQDAANIRQTVAYESRRAASEAEARGNFSATAFPNGQDYDSMRARYLEPVYRDNPSLRSLGATLYPEKPAVGEMFMAAFLHVRDQHKGDDVAAIKAIFNASGARAAGSQDVAQSIDQAAKRGAAQIMRERGPGAATPKKLDSQAIWNMSDDEFRQLERQNGTS